MKLIVIIIYRIMNIVELSDGQKLPMIGFGTYLCKPELVFHSVLSALQIGYRHIDTAEFYANEEEVGRAVKSFIGDARNNTKRADIFVTTKVSPGGIFGIPAKTYDETISACRSSLAKLQTEYIDCVLLHAAFPTTEQRHNQYKAVLLLQSEGIIRSVGVSNWNIGHLEELRTAGLPLPVVNQIEIHPLCCQLPLVQYLRSHNIMPVAYSSLAPLSSWRSDVGQLSSKTDEDRREQGKLTSMMERYGVTEAQILLRWAVQLGYPILPKSDDVARQRVNFDVFSFDLCAEDVATLNSFDLNKPFAWPGMNPLNC